jgi:hypothetical protein
MRKNLIIFFFLILLGVLQPAQAQTTKEDRGALSKAKKEALRMQLNQAGIIYPIENNFGFRLASNGLNLYYENLKFVSVNHKRLITADFYYFVDFKERQITTYPFGGNDQNTYHYGKLNDLFGFRFAYGFRKAITDKTESDEIQVSYTLAGGITLGLLKPYYLDISYGIVTLNPGTNNAIYNEVEVKPERLTEENRNIFLTQSVVQVSGDRYAYIVGSSSFGEGFSQLQLVPGLHGRFGFNFDWGQNDVVVKQMEVGVMLDLYNKNLPLYYRNFNSQFNFSLYLSVGIGKRRTLHNNTSNETDE